MKTLLILALALFSFNVHANIRTYKTKIMDEVVIGAGLNADSLKFDMSKSERYAIQILAAGTGITGVVTPYASVDCVNFGEITTAAKNFTGTADLSTYSNVSYPCGRIRISNAGANPMTVSIILAIKEEH
jgi:predicted methyltransferase